MLNCMNRTASKVRRNQNILPDGQSLLCPFAIDIRHPWSWVAPYLRYVKFLTLICLISHRMSHCQNTRDKDFLFKPKWISYQISQFAFIAQVIFLSTFVSFARDFKIKFSKTKSPRIDPFVRFPFILLRNRSKKIDKGQKEKKRWAFLGTEERILLGDRVMKEILQGFIFLFHLVDSF